MELSWVVKEGLGKRAGIEVAERRAGRRTRAPPLDEDRVDRKSMKAA